MYFSDILRAVSEKFEIVSGQMGRDVQIFSIAELRPDASPSEGVLQYTKDLASFDFQNVPDSIIWCGPRPELLQEYNVNWIRVKPANKKSSPKQDLTKENNAGSR